MGKDWDEEMAKEMMGGRGDGIDFETFLKVMEGGSMGRLSEVPETKPK